MNSSEVYILYYLLEGFQRRTLYELSDGVSILAAEEIDCSRVDELEFMEYILEREISQCAMQVINCSITFHSIYNVL